MSGSVHIETALRRDSLGIMDIAHLIEIGTYDPSALPPLLEDTQIRLSVLHIMSELSNDKSIGIWKSALEYIRDSNPSTVWYVLDILEGQMENIRASEALDYLSSVEAVDPSISRKVAHIHRLIEGLR